MDVNYFIPDNNYTINLLNAEEKNVNSVHMQSNMKINIQ